MAKTQTLSVSFTVAELRAINMACGEHDFSGRPGWVSQAASRACKKAEVVLLGKAPAKARTAKAAKKPAKKTAAPTRAAARRNRRAR